MGRLLEPYGSAFIRVVARREREEERLEFGTFRLSEEKISRAFIRLAVSEILASTVST